MKLRKLIKSVCTALCIFGIIPVMSMNVQAHNQSISVTQNISPTQNISTTQNIEFNIITDITVSGSQAIVALSVSRDCRVVVGIYEEDGIKMIGSGMAEVAAGSTEATVDLSVSDMTQCYYIKVYIIEDDSLDLIGNIYAKWIGVRRGDTLSMGGYHSAMITTDDELFMWGYNNYGQIGVGTISVPIYNVPRSVLRNVANMSLGHNHSGAITKDGILYMWGNNDYGQLGNGSISTSNTVPIEIMNNAGKVSLGYNHSAVVTTDGNLYIWGANSEGQLGNGTNTDTNLPEKIMDNIASVELGYNHSAAITTDGSLYMWGDNDYGQLGNGANVDSNFPVKIMDSVVAVSLGQKHTAAVTTDGTLYMWGNNEHGQLGNGTNVDSNIPVKVMDDIESVNLGPVQSAAITIDGTLYTWGQNEYGQLGNGSRDKSSEPVKIMDNVAEVSMGESHTAILTIDGGIYTCGDNYRGQLGNGVSDLEQIVTSMEKIMEIAATNNSGELLEYSDLIPNENYMFYIMKSKNNREPLSSDNLLYIGNGTSDTDGILSFRYDHEKYNAIPDIFVVGKTRIDLEDVDIQIPDVEWSGNEQEVNPILTYDGEILVRGIDYELNGNYKATTVGEYTFSITGIGLYKGTVIKEYRVSKLAYQITASAILTNTTAYEAEISGGGSYFYGDVATITVSESDKNAHPFKGWYYRLSDGSMGELVSESLSYTFFVTGAVDYIAVFEAGYDVNSNGLVLEFDGKYHYHVKGKTDTTKNGLILFRGIWYYLEEGIWIQDKYDFVEYDGAKFLVANGVVADLTGLQLYNDKWYYLSNGQLHDKYTGLTTYDGEWFYVINGILAAEFNGVQDYDGATFLIAAGRILFAYSGLYQDYDVTWYYVASGQVQTQYTGLVQYDKRWFLVDKGILAYDYSGWIWYEGVQFYILNGMVVGQNMDGNYVLTN